MKKTYNIELSKKASKFILNQSKNQQKRLLKAIYKLPEGIINPLKGYEPMQKIRVGDYRIIFEINEKQSLIRIYTIGNRGDVYKKI
ncbi:type II toxin-antitoxin system RelE/ParE family toxin [Aceticella autotrophica]|uniref:Type II toxin-antitoxin system RelE/ParE family toxin n=1 Tax=Aceticella autotrophica TaxID=2755338 RepID=A0A975GB33_9THEO|nr:type II toxin-antitoxin system RelE/ParE family toxin [Aceticella autotrophica]QSZ28013.1 type II toxin-antitoxin system RelE/ParE family toxin [Aceticella autotrophica]